MSPEITQEKNLNSRFHRVEHQLLEVHLLLLKGDLEVSDPPLAAEPIVAIITLWLQLATIS